MSEKLPSSSKRKEHVAKTLAKQHDRARREVDETFLCVPLFKNELPDVPIGPYFTKYKLQHIVEDYGKYLMSSLEKSYTWHPHYDSSMGLNLDFVDKPAILVPYSEDSGKIPVHPSDSIFLSNQNPLKKMNDDKAEKPWWLRSTTYLENDLYKSRAAKVDSAAAGEVNNMLDPFTEEYIRGSFEAVRKMKNTTGKQIVWSMPILPSDVVGDQSTFIRFDANYDRPADETEESDEPESKKLRTNCLLTNMRVVSSGVNHTHMSMVAPADEGRSPSDGSDEPIHYDWVRDFKLDVRQKNLQSLFLLSLDEEAMQCRYSRIHTTADMQKLGAEESAPHEVWVTRRPFDEQTDRSGA